VLSREPDMGLGPATLGSWPELKPRVRCFADCATQAPQDGILLSRSSYGSALPWELDRHQRNKQTLGKSHCWHLETGEPWTRCLLSEPSGLICEVEILTHIILSHGSVARTVFLAYHKRFSFPISHKTKELPWWLCLASSYPQCIRLFLNNKSDTPLSKSLS